MKKSNTADAISTLAKMAATDPPFDDSKKRPRPVAGVCIDLQDGEGGERRGLLRDEQLYTLALRGHERGGCNAASRGAT